MKTVNTLDDVFVRNARLLRVNILNYSTIIVVVYENVKCLTRFYDVRWNKTNLVDTGETCH